MTTAVFDTLKASDDLKAAGIEAKHAEAIVHTMAGAFEDTVATKSDVVAIRADMDKLEVSVKADIASVRAELKDKATKTDLAEVKAEVFRALWIQGAGIVGIQLAIAGLLFAAIRFLGQPV